MDISAIALQGLQQAEAQLSPDGASLDAADLSAELVALMSAKTQFTADLSSLKTADEIQQKMIDLKA